MTLAPSIHDTPAVHDDPLTHPLAPHYCACQLLRISNTSDRHRVKAVCKERIVNIVEDSIAYHKAIHEGGMTLLMRAVTGDEVSASFKITQKRELLFFLWMSARVAGSRRFFIRYHCNEDGSPHNINECSCTNIEEDEVFKYKPHDELLAYLSYLFESEQVRIRDEDSDSEREDDIRGLFDM